MCSGGLIPCALVCPGQASIRWECSRAHSSATSARSYSTDNGRSRLTSSNPRAALRPIHLRHALHATSGDLRVITSSCPRPGSRHGLTPPLTTKGPTTRHYQSHVTRNPSKSACHEDLTPPPSAARGSPHPSSCTPPTNLGLVGARTARHDREPGGLQVRVRVSLAEEKGHQEAALLAELDQRK